jgi:L-lactate dehydrogenase complex protein LldG
MSDERLRLFSRVRSALAPLATRESMPAYADDDTVARGALEGKTSVDAFVEQLQRSGGRAFTDAHSLARWLAERGTTHGYCDPVLQAELAPAFAAPLFLESQLVRERIDDYGFGITRAAGAIAETGTLILDDATTSRRLGALAPWVHIAVLRPNAIHLRVVDALRALGTDPNVIWCTGPSKTADVEGILIERVHGPGEEIALILPQP